MAHEILQGRVVGVWQVIDSFVKPDVPQAIIFNFCLTRQSHKPVVASEGGRGRWGQKKCLLAASKKPWCSCIVRSGSGSSLSHSFRTLVTLLMSLDHSSASRFVASRSVGCMSVSCIKSQNLPWPVTRLYRVFLSTE
jgi:hypothetical protein